MLFKGVHRAHLSRINPRLGAVVVGLLELLVIGLDWRFSPNWPVSHLYYLPIALAGAFFGFPVAVPLALASAGVFGALDFGYRSLPLTEADVIRVVLFVAVALVASALRRDAQELARTATSLEQANNKLAELNAALHHERQLRVQYVARAAHDLAQPLTAMKAGADLLLRFREPGRQVLSRHLAAIAANGRRAAGMLDNLVEAARIEAQGIQLRPTDGVAVQEIVEEAANTFRCADARSIEVAIASDLPPIRADERYLLRVLLNIVGNAVKYSPPESPIWIAAGRDDDAVRMSILDQGVGIPTAELQQVLQPFGRSVSAGRAPGFGLGLAISQEIVVAHGGRLDIDSRPGKGTTVHIWLPLAGPPASEPASLSSV